MNGARTRVSLAEFIASDRLSKVDFRLHDGSRSSGDGSTSREGRREPFCLGASRLALLLARVFAKLEREDRIESACLQLDNFSVNLELDDASYNPEQKKDQSDFGDDDFDNLLSDVLDDPPGQNDSISEVTAETAGERMWIVLDAEFRPAAVEGSDRSLYSAFIHGRVSPMQILGNHINTIFSMKNPRTLAFLHRTMAPAPEPGPGTEMLPEEYEECSGGRSSKQRARGTTSLFSTLLERGEYPAAVCRLLSDTMGSGEGGQSNDPFASFEEVIRDLEQMTNLPEIFLDDQTNEFYSSGLHFGQRCYGRARELERFLEISTRLEQSEGTSHCDGAEAVFVSGVAGSGKSNLVQNVGGFLTNLGWTVLRAKFKREMEHDSREIVSSLFEGLVANIAAMEGGDDAADIEYHRRATRAISEAMDPAHLSCLANFIPSIYELFPRVDANNVSLSAGDDVSLWQLVFLLSRLVGVVLGLGRNVLLCLDDLQWCVVLRDVCSFDCITAKRLLVAD